MSHLTFRRAAACLPVFAFAVYPIVFIATVNAGVLPLDGVGIVRGLAVACGAAAALLVVGRLLPWEFEAVAAWLGFTLLFFIFYTPLRLAVGATGWRPAPDNSVLAIAFVAGSAALAAMIVRPWQARRRSPVALSAVAIALLGVNIGSQVVQSASRSSLEHLKGPVRQPAVPVVWPPERDIYYLVLDGFGRPDVLQSRYGLDISSFTRFLSVKGFTVPAEARANYSQTYLSLASTLNLAYLDDVAAAVGEQSHDRRPLKRLIDRNALMAAAHAAGYRVYVVGSAYSATQTIDAADICLCDRRGLSELEHEALMSTPLAAMPLSRWTYDAHRAKILDSLAAVEALAREPGPLFVFAHVVVPHPPFVFAADGTARQPNRPFNFRDANQFDGTTDEYVQGYRDQTQYLVGRLTRLVETLTARPGPAPVIVIHGDHGPQSSAGTGRGADDAHERMPIFAAYAFPGSTDPGDARITPVNVARTLARQYLGVDAPSLTDASYFSTWEEPYRFIAVPPTEVAARKAGP